MAPAAAPTPPLIDEPEPPQIDVGGAVPCGRSTSDATRSTRSGSRRSGAPAGLAESPKPSPTTPRPPEPGRKGAVGEERVAQILQERLGDSAVLLHDRKVPGTRGNIDHIAIAACSGVWIIDAKRYKGKVEKRDKGGWFSSDLRLYVGGRAYYARREDGLGKTTPYAPPLPTTGCRCTGR